MLGLIAGLLAPLAGFLRERHGEALLSDMLAAPPAATFILWADAFAFLKLVPMAEAAKRAEPSAKALPGT